MSYLRKLKIISACLALIGLFSQNLVILLFLTLGCSIFSLKKFTDNKILTYILIFIGISFLPYLIFRENTYLLLTISFVCRSLILYFALQLLTENINFEKTRLLLIKFLGKNFTLALTLAFNLLPLIKHLLRKNHGLFYLKQQRKKNKLKQLICFALTIFRQIIHTAESCAENLILLEQGKQPQIILLTGPKHSGKTTYALELVTKFRNNNWPVSGILAPSTLHNNRRSTIYVTDLATNTKRLLASRELKIENIAYEYGGFNFAQAGLEFARQALKNTNKNDIVFLDEYGPLEFANLGFADEFKQLTASNISAIFVIIREELVQRFLSYHNNLSCEIINITEAYNPQTISQYSLMPQKTNAS